ncbi:polyphosphate polymerase domain-containing protein [Anaerocolumna xylanovorans]|uniref:VTC domain-containing protein n=1 Tax=Anaerocolumna xylanovorans DSM 12503 TaxID=1121345 RepID=A0A1M7Y031_9FIRM|nr:polyphosphate polymerase domain-containing protein [Anaerocolumna xylanovorans]SHO44641.1 VTC domain-containing protein [Anaerocolumna xylanovorans DSM 12503]
MNEIKSNNTFERIEKKYLLSSKDYDLLKNRLLPYMKMDQYGLHTICNIYFDTENYELVRNSIEKPVYKEKLRLRSYGVPTGNSKVFLEIKKKYKGIVYKRRVSITLEEAVRYLGHGIKPAIDNQILREIDYFIHFYKPIPKVYLAYDRIALYGITDPDIRITFDQNIRSRLTDLDLSKGDYGKYLLDQSNVLMEIKVPAAYPLWLANILSDLRIYPASFSKYGNVYKENLLEERNESLCLQAL